MDILLLPEMAFTGTCRHDDETSDADSVEKAMCLRICKKSRHFLRIVKLGQV